MRHARSRRLLVALAAAAAMVAPAALVAVASAPPTPVDAARPFADVQGSPMRFEPDPFDPSRAIFRVTTTEPMICAIVWGPTEALGRFNNSLAMSGTGIVEHDVVLPGVVSGETYYYVVQGTTADGTWYRSGRGTFTVEAPTAATAAGTTAGGVNLAESAAVLDVSSEFGDAWVATNAIDGSGLTEWSSAGDGDDAFITIDLGVAQTIAGVEFITRSMADGTAVTETFTATIDDETYGPFPAGTPADPAPATIDATGRIVRFDVEASTGGNVGAVEIRVLAPDEGA